jgi:hypothetical protein
MPGIRRVEKTGEIGSDGHGQHPASSLEEGALFVRKAQDAFKGAEITNSVADLPPPVVPLRSAYRREKLPSELQ